MKKGDMVILLWRIPLDFLALTAAWFLAYGIRPYTDLIPGVQRYFPPEQLPLLDFFMPFALISAAVFVLLMLALRHYQFAQKFEPWREFLRLIFTVLLWGMLLVAWYALFRHELIFSRIVLMHTMFFGLVFAFGIRIVLHTIQVWNWKAGKNRRRIILFGTAEKREKMKSMLQDFPQFEITAEFDIPQISALRKFNAEVDELWRCDAQVSETVATVLHELCLARHWLFRFVPQADTLSFAKLELMLLGNMPLILVLPTAPTLWQRVLKRLFDLIFSSVVLLILSPFFLLFALLIKLDSPGPVFYKSRRSGRQGRKFLLWKFRSMQVDADAQKRKLQKHSHRDGPFFKVKNDPRVTRFGRFLRRFSLDELPNLVNVWKGDLSLIGPRPHLPEEVSAYAQEQKQILMMKPGVTGLAQISGRSDLPFADEVRLDLYYLENWNFWLDLKILLKTLVIIFKKEGAD